MRGIICFDMDGTIADLYGYPNWLKLLRKEDPWPDVFPSPCNGQVFQEIPVFP